MLCLCECSVHVIQCVKLKFTWSPCEATHKCKFNRPPVTLMREVGIWNILKCMWKSYFIMQFFSSTRLILSLATQFMKCKNVLSERLRSQNLISTTSTIYYEVRANFITKESVRALNCMQWFFTSLKLSLNNYDRNGHESPTIQLKKFEPSAFYIPPSPTVPLIYKIPNVVYNMYCLSNYFDISLHMA